VCCTSTGLGIPATGASGAAVASLWNFLPELGLLCTFEYVGLPAAYILKDHKADIHPDPERLSKGE